MAQTQSVTLDKGWEWKEVKTNASDDNNHLEASTVDLSKWRAASSFPSEIHTELLYLGLIPDPKIGFNEHQVQWVGQREWRYRCSFPSSQDHTLLHELQFDGLDTICDIYLNDVHVLKTENMFRSYTLSIDQKLLRPVNNLVLHFKSALEAAKELEKKYGKVRAGSANLGDPSRVYLRKAQYDWRWDWGPELMTCGPYRPIKYVVFDVRIDDIHPRIFVSGSSSQDRSLKLDLDISRRVSGSFFLSCALKTCDKSRLIREECVYISIDTEKNSTVALKDVLHWQLNGAIELWWPIGYGEQSLYILEVSLLDSQKVVQDQIEKRIGFRHIELIQQPLATRDGDIPPWPCILCEKKDIPCVTKDGVPVGCMACERLQTQCVYSRDGQGAHKHGSTFLFQVNGVRMFMGGSNWIPADNFLTSINSSRYRDWLTLLKDGNQNMVRLWGGGIYEPDLFYDICDELGILVWQDFQFACGVYPGDQEFVENVRLEAVDNVKRLRHHPSIAIFCGNNEDYQQVLQWGDVEDLPARVLYENVLPEVVATYTDPPIPYHRGSPYGGEGWDTADPTIGDVHQWDIWGGKELPWQRYALLGGRFVSEFGIPAMPDIRTIDYWLDGNKKERWAQSRLMAQHNKAGSHERRFAILMNDNFKLTSDFETHVYHTQMLQSEALGFAYRMWRRQWRGKGKEYCAGALVWQLNDCWPVTSWSLADYFLRPKPSYYSVARELNKITVGAYRIVHKNRDNDRPAQFYEFGAFQSVSASLYIWGSSFALEEKEFTLELSCFDLGSDWTYQHEYPVTLSANSSTNLLFIDCPCPPRDLARYHPGGPSITTSYSVVASVRILDKDGNVVSRYSDWPQPFRHVDFPDPGINISISEDDRVTVSVNKPVKGLVFSTGLDTQETEEVVWSDNALDVVPNDPQTIHAKGLGQRELVWRHMGFQENA